MRAALSTVYKCYQDSCSTLGLLSTVASTALTAGGAAFFSGEEEVLAPSFCSYRPQYVGRQ